MSITATFKTAITDPDLLCAAIKILYGKNAATIVRSKNGDSVILHIPKLYRRTPTFFSKEIGGYYELTYDDIDRSKLSKLFPNGAVNELAQVHSKLKVMEAIKMFSGASVINDFTDEDNVNNIRISTANYQ